MRIGHGYDVHKLEEGRALVIGGVSIPYEKGLLGHSDADVLIHAIMDSLLGAAALGDIGKIFPDTNEQYRDANSLFLLKNVCNELHLFRYSIVNIDSTIVAQAPKMLEYISQMKKNISKTCGISEAQINIKATTEERLGFTGRLEGISAHAVSLIN